MQAKKGSAEVPWRVRSKLGWLLWAILAAACTDSTTPYPQSPEAVRLTAQISQAERDAATQGRTARGFEDDLLRLEARVPGLGGLYADSSGEFVMFLKDTSILARARAIEEFRTAPSIVLAPEHRSRLDAGGPVHTRLAQFAFSDLVAWQEPPVTPTPGRERIRWY
jgi:hypothetical protein